MAFNNGGLPTLVRNELYPGNDRSDSSDGSGRWLRVFLDTAARADLAPDGFGTLVAVRTGDTRQVRYIGAAAGYLGPSELSAHFGVGAAPVAAVTDSPATGITRRAAVVVAPGPNRN